MFPADEDINWKKRNWWKKYLIIQFILFISFIWFRGNNGSFPLATKNAVYITGGYGAIRAEMKLLCLLQWFDIYNGGASIPIQNQLFYNEKALENNIMMTIDCRLNWQTNRMTRETILWQTDIQGRRVEVGIFWSEDKITYIYAIMVGNMARSIRLININQNNAE